MVCDFLTPVPLVSVRSFMNPDQLVCADTQWTGSVPSERGAPSRSTKGAGGSPPYRGPCPIASQLSEILVDYATIIFFTHEYFGIFTDFFIISFQIIKLLLHLFYAIQHF